MGFPILDRVGWGEDGRIIPTAGGTIQSCRGPLGSSIQPGYTCRPEHHAQDIMTDAELLSQIVAALSQGRVEIAFSSGLESHMDFPGNSETDKGQFILPSILLVGAAWWFGGWPAFGAVILLLAGLYYVWWRKVVRARMRRRFVAKAMTDLKLWRKSWGFDGISLKAGETQCLSPKGDWRAFAAALKQPIAT